MGTAKQVGRLKVSEAGAVQQVYQLNPPLVVEDWLAEQDEDESSYASHEFVLVSSVDAMFSGPETYIFACDKDGKVDEWIELPGSFQGEQDHAKALRLAGYEVES